MGSWPSIAEGCAFATQTRSPSIGCSSARSLGATSPIGRRPGTSTSTSTASSSGRRAPAAEAVAAGSLEPAAHLGAADEPALLPDLLPALEHDEVRDGPGAVLGREPGVRLRVHPEDDGAPRHVLGHPLYLRSRHATGAAPRRPEIHEHGDGRLAHDGLE